MNDDLVPVLHVYVRMYADKPHIHTRYTHMYNEFNRIIKKYQRKCLYTHTHPLRISVSLCRGSRCLILLVQSEIFLYICFPNKLLSTRRVSCL